MGLLVAFVLPVCLDAASRVRGSASSSLSAAKVGVTPPLQPPETFDADVVSDSHTRTKPESYEAAVDYLNKAKAAYAREEKEASSYQAKVYDAKMKVHNAKGAQAEKAQKEYDALLDEQKKHQNDAKMMAENVRKAEEEAKKWGYSGASQATVTLGIVL